MAILQNHFHQAQTKRNLWVAELDPNTKYEDVLKTEFWPNVARQMTPGDIITVRPADMSYFAELIVVYAAPTEDKGWIKVAELRYVHLDKTVPASDFDKEELYPKLAGVARWRVMKRSTNEVMVSNLATKDDAINWIKQFKAIHEAA